jgi:hypothetical protein
MQMRDIGILTAGAELIPHTIGNNSQPLVARNSFAQSHLNICKEIIMSGPAVPMIDNDVTTGDPDHVARPGRSHPII